MYEVIGVIVLCGAIAGIMIAVSEYGMRCRERDAKEWEDRYVVRKNSE